MTRRGRLAELASSRRVIVVFCLLAIVPVSLAAVSFRQPFQFSPDSLSVLEPLFRATVYVPVSAIRTVVFGPLGLAGVFAIPVLGHLLVFLSLFAFYYCLSLLLVAGGAVVREALAAQ